MPAVLADAGSTASHLSNVGQRSMRRSLLRVAAAMLCAASPGSAFAQSFSENFDDVASLPGNGWFVQNNSVPLGSTSWFQGRPLGAGGPFDAFSGAPSAYIAADFRNTGQIGTISTWLLTPNRTFRNGDVLRFHTRKAAPDDYADRLEVRRSLNGASTNVGADGTAVGDFTTLVLSINPSLVLGVYPTTWTQYTITISGLPAPTSGRMAFRYFVSGGGVNGTNSDYIGIDNVAYTPYVCPAFTMTPGGPLTGGISNQAYLLGLTQSGALGAPAYAVTAGALPPGLVISSAGSISGTPTAIGTFNFTVTVSDASGCSDASSYSITVVPGRPGAPQNVAASAGDALAEVTWDAPANDGGDPIIGYSASCTDGSNSFSGAGTAAPIAVTGLANGTTYACTVAASNGVGQGDASAPSNSVTPTGNQSITFDVQADQTYRPGGTFAIDPQAIASSGLAVTHGSSTPGVCTVSGTTVTIVASGTCTLTADQGGDTAWNAATQATRSLAIARASQVLTFPTQTVASRFFVSGSVFAIAPEASSAEPNSGAPILYDSLDESVCWVDGTNAIMVAEGSCRISANQAGDANFLAAAQVVSEVVLMTPEADLWIEKSAATARARIGDTVVYTIVVGNHGPVDATDVGVLDVPPERLDPATVVWECIEATGTACPDPDADQGELDATIALLPEGASVRFELLGVVIPAANPGNDFAPFDNTASIALPQGSSLVDPAGNNESTASVLVVPESAFADGFEASSQ